MDISDLPVGAVIAVDDEGSFEKRENGLWYSLTGENRTYSSDVLDNDIIDKVRIVSLPFGVVWQMAILLGDEYGSVDSEGEPITYDGLIKGAIESYQEEKIRSRAANNVG